MPRPERALDADGGALVQFAAELRKLRGRAGNPPYRVLARRANYSAAALAAAASGHRLPTLAVTQAYVAACGGDTAAWEARWRAVAGANWAAGDPGQDGAPAPYRGMAMFDTADADWFFGRRQLVAALIRRLIERRFLAVFGPSGVGKSSLLRAGLIPAVRNGTPPEDHGWLTLVMTPGADPLAELGVQLAALAGVSAGLLAEDLAAHPARAHLAARQAVAQRPGQPELLLVVDQFEELFTLCGSHQRRDQFVAALLAMCQAADSRTRVVLGVRADFYARCAEHSRLVDALADAQVLVGAMDGPQIREAVVKPAERAGLIVEGALVSRVVAEVAGRPGALPIAAHALLQAWRRRRGATITLAGYDAAGGMEGAVIQTAEAVWMALDDDQQHAARQALLRLVQIDEAGEAVRRRVPRAEFAADTMAVVDRFVAARLLSLDRDTVEVAHESLIRAWPRLRAWVDDDRAGLHWHRQLTAATATWRSLDRDPGALYRGLRLSITAHWRGTRPMSLSPGEREFLEASLAAQRRETRIRRYRQRSMLAGVCTAMMMMGLLAGAAWVKDDQARTQRDLAVSQRAVTNARIQLSRDPELALLLARDAYRRHPDPASIAVLRQAVAESRVTEVLPNSQKVVSVAISPDGRRLAGADLRGSLKIWDLARRTEPVSLGDADSYVTAVNFSPDNRYLVTGGYAEAPSGHPGRVALWDLSGPQPRAAQSMTGPTAFEHVAVSDQDGRTVVGTDYQGSVWVWDAATGAALDAFPTGGEGVAGIDVSADGHHVIVVGGHGTVQIRDVTTYQSKQLSDGGDHPGVVQAVDFSDDGRQVAIGTSSSVAVSDATDSARGTLLRDMGALVEGVALSPDTHRVAAVSSDGTIRIWGVADPSRPLILRGPPSDDHMVRAIRFSPDGRRLASTVGSFNDRGVRIWDVTGRANPRIAGDNAATAVSPGGRFVASVVSGGTLQVSETVHPGQPVLLDDAGAHAGDMDLALSEDGQHAVGLAPAEGVGRLWNRATGPRATVLRCDEADPAVLASSAYISQDGSRVATVCGNARYVRVWDTRDLVTYTLNAVASRFGTLAFSQDGQYLAATLPGSQQIAIYREGGRDPFRLPWQDSGDGLAFSPDARRLAAMSQDGTIRLWALDAHDTNPIIRFGPVGGMRSLAFSPDGHRLAAIGMNDRTVRVFDTDGAGEPVSLPLYGSPPRWITFTPDGTGVVSLHDDHSVRTWPCDACGPVSDVLDRADQRTTRSLTPGERRAYLSPPTER